MGYIVIRCLGNDYNWLPRHLKAGLILSDDDFMGLTVSAFLTSHFHDINGWGDPFRRWINTNSTQLPKNRQENLDLVFRCRPSFLKPEYGGREYLDLIRSSLFIFITYPSISPSPNPPFPLYWVSIRPQHHGEVNTRRCGHGRSHARDSGHEGSCLSV